MMVQSIDPWGLVLCFAGASVILLLIRSSGIFDSPQSTLNPSYSTHGDQQKFYEALDTAIDGRLLILSKVRIADSSIHQRKPFGQAPRLSVDCLQTRGLCFGRRGGPSSAGCHRVGRFLAPAGRHRQRDELLDDLFQKLRSR